MQSTQNWITGLLIVSLLASILIPVAITNFLGADQSGWDTQTIALWAIIPVFIVIALVLKILKGGGIGSGR